jgi:simple sugar transport system permease protein
MHLSPRAEAMLLPLAAVAIALILGAGLILTQDANPFTAYKALLTGAFGSWGDFARTLEKTTPLILTGLAVIVALKGGLFNIGAQGQLLMGALFSAWAGYQITGLPRLLHVPLALAFGIGFGMLSAAFAGFLKAWRGAHEVITTIMLNAIIINLTEYLAGGPWQEKGQAITRTPRIEGSAKIGRLADLPVGFFLALLCAVGVWFLINRTTTGFAINTVGANKNAANYGGIAVAKITVLTMAISGGLAGLGGAIETQGVVGRYEPGFNSGLGFDGITVALLARTQPLAAIPAALLIGIMRAGGTEMAFKAGVEQEIVDVILATILLLVAAPIVVRWLLRLRKSTTATDTIRLTSGWGA